MEPFECVKMIELCWFISVGCLSGIFWQSKLVGHLIPNPLYFNDISTIVGYLSHNLFIRGSLNKFPDFLRMGTFIDSTHTKL